jgi:hypothetical protein
LEAAACQTTSKSTTAKSASKISEMITFQRFIIDVSKWRCKRIIHVHT